MPHRRNDAGGAGFTLIEVVLAIALASVVMYLLTTAIELYMVRVDASRTRVESAQVARVLLNQIADDLKAARMPLPASSGAGASSGGSSAGGSSGAGGSAAGSDPTGGAGGGAAGGAGNTGAMGADSGATGGSAATGSASGALASSSGVSGTELELRIQRAAPSSWDRTTLSEESLLQNDASHSGITVRYFMHDGRQVLPHDFAELGVEAEPSRGVSGLYRETAATATLLDAEAASVTSGGSASTASQGLSNTSELELLAPEVIELTFAYFDGETMLEEWDATTQTGQPLGVEIRLKVLQLSYEEAAQRNAERSSQTTSVREEDVVEYRRFVYLPVLRSPRVGVQHLLLPQGGQGSGRGVGGSGGPGGEAGDDSAGGGGGPGGNPNQFGGS